MHDMHGWQDVLLDEIEDPKFDTSTARMDSGCFILEGVLEWTQALYSIEMPRRDRLKMIREIRRDYGRARKVIFSPIRLVIDNAVGFTIDDRSDLELVVLEDYRMNEKGITLVGGVECDITVTTNGPAVPRLRFGPLDFTRAEAAKSRALLQQNSWIPFRGAR